VPATALPPAIQPAGPAPFVVLSRDDGSEIVTSLDLPLVLAKGGRNEDVLVRRALFITASITVVRPAGAADAASDGYRWRYEAFLQRQICFTSMTGLFSCTLAQVESLPDKATGEAPLPATVSGAPVFSEADSAKRSLTEGLRARAGALFEADRRANVDPVFKAAGVAVLKAAPRRPAGRPATGGPAARGDSGG
jgi:hypothetical protein